MPHERGCDLLGCYLVRLGHGYLQRSVRVGRLLTMLPPVADLYCDVRGCFATFFLLLILILVN